jgi:uncharacterized protein (DUF305 family)
MRARRLILASLLAAGLGLPPALQPAAQQAAMPQHGGGDGMHGPAMHDATERMRRGVDTPSSGDPDVDFARMMIPHHEGAIEMAKSQLENGKDPELRRLAEEIIAAQEKEIAFFQGWLRQHGG